MEIGTEEYTVYGVRLASDGKASVELQATGGGGHVTILVDEADAPALRARVDGEFRVVTGGES